MKFPNARLLIMSKAPDPGQVKTRLIPLLGAGAAAELYAGLVHDCLDMGTTACARWSCGAALPPASRFSGSAAQTSR